MPNTNPSIGSRSTCRECGQPIGFNGQKVGWIHDYGCAFREHKAVPIDHAEPVKPRPTAVGDTAECVVCDGKIKFIEVWITEGELIRTWEHVPEIPRFTTAWHQARPKEVKPSPADARTVEELVGEIRNMLTTCKYDAYDGCVTGDCPHEKQFECVGALAAMLTKRETEIDSSIAALEELARWLGVGK